MSNISGIISALACLMLVSCSGAANYADGDNQKRNEVQMIKIPFMVTFVAGSSELTNESIKQLDMFMMRSNVSFGDELSLDFPLNRNGSLSEISQKRMAFMSKHLKERGLHLSSEVTPYGMSPMANQARFLISRYVVTPPTCGNWSQPSTGNYGNAGLQEMGCANQANLGLMVANPRDLIVGAANGAPDTENSAKAVHTFRAKPQTKLSKNSKKKSK
ncbi:MAG: hypothetical protein KAI89_07525 [Emcibacter sp.]|nr:hypothetical protein [Emcibacter sp.]